MEKELKVWLSLNLKGKNLEVFFLKNQIKTIAIYGGGLLGNLFYKDIKKYGVDVKFCIDREITQFHDILTIKPDQLANAPEIDVVVICNSNDKRDDIYPIIHKAGFNAIILMEILNTCYYHEIVIPYCKSMGVIPYILSWTYQDQLNNLSPFERAIASIRNTADDCSRNPSYFNEIYMPISEYGDEYIRDVFTLSPSIRKGNSFIHSDITSKYVNVINGIRFTDYTPEDYNRTIYIFGSCVVFGYGVDDSRTIASCLQKYLNETIGSYNQFRVVNYGFVGCSGNDAYALASKLYDIPCKKGDIVVFFNNTFRFYDRYKDMCISNILKPYYYCLFNNFCEPRKNQPLYIDHRHLSHWGMDRAAKYIFDLVQQDIKKLDMSLYTNVYAEERTETSQTQVPDSLKKETLEDYISFLKPYRKDDCFSNGAIVMNCNPFTNGHRYLIETASQQVDFLYVFVVEEDRSDFAFDDRLKLVRLGTADLENVIVLPSGKFILSAVTFPEYFIKDSLQEITIDTSKDIEIFSQKIVPVLNIKKRFVGEEPFDRITMQYNQTMKDIMPKYNIELVEVKRACSDGNPISASMVRKLLEQNKWGEISKLVPDVTLEYLKRNHQYK